MDMKYLILSCLVLLLVSVEARKHHHERHRDETREIEDGEAEQPQAQQDGQETEHHLQWKNHKPVDESEDTYNKEIWKQITDYHKSDDEECKKLKCKKHSVCLVHAETGQAECVPKRLLRQQTNLHGDAENNAEIEHLDETSESEQEMRHKVQQSKRRSDEYQHKHDEMMKHKLHIIKKIDSNVKLHNTAEHKAHRMCTNGEMEELGRRMLDWFKVMQDRDQHHLEKRNSMKKELRQDDECICQSPVTWQFGRLDRDSDGHLDGGELDYIEGNGYEHCVRPFVHACDHDKDSKLSEKEWCCCFTEIVPPCEAQKRIIPAESIDGVVHMPVGAFVPQCDEDGFFEEIQCHSSIGYCWCVDRNGLEVEGTKTRGDPQCEITEDSQPED